VEQKLNYSKMFCFLSSNFRYLDQVGMAAKYNTEIYCRQTLVGANYALLDRTTMEPNPDYYMQELLFKYASSIFFFFFFSFFFFFQKGQAYLMEQCLLLLNVFF
jgi:hypothetical protein